MTSDFIQPPSGENHRHRTIWRVAALAVLIVIFYFGLDPRGGPYTNSVAWIETGPGLRFQKYAVAYTAPVFHSSPSPGISLETVIKPLPAGQEGFALLMVFHDGDDGTQLLLGQWRSWLIFMNGDDYAHKRKLKRLSANIGGTLGEAILVTLTSGEEGSHLYIDGKPVAGRSDAVFTIPAGKTGTRLVVGNSVYGKHSWSGDIYGISVYRRALSAQEVAHHYGQWRAAGALSARPAVAAMYTLTEGRGTRAADSIGGADLQLPPKMPILKKQFLSASALAVDVNAGLFQDLLLNLLGFIPLGFALYKATAPRGRNASARTTAAIVAVGFLVSLMIEITQAWMPTRDSSLADLVLNTVGTLVGAAAGIMAVRKSVRANETA